VRREANLLSRVHIDDKALFAWNGHLDVRGIFTLDNSLNVERDAARQTFGSLRVGRVRHQDALFDLGSTEIRKARQLPVRKLFCEAAQITA